MERLNVDVQISSDIDVALMRVRSIISIGGLLNESTEASDDVRLPLIESKDALMTLNPPATMQEKAVRL